MTKKQVVAAGIAAGVLVLSGVALAHGPGMSGGGYGHMWGGGGRMGPGMGPGMMMQGAGAQGDCPGYAATGQTAQISEARAQELAQAYADTHLKGFTVDKVLPFAAGHGTAYSVELKGAEGEVRTLHVNPWGRVMPFGGPGFRRAG